MGGAVSAGEDNNELVDNLVEAEYIKTALIEKVFRAVDRGDYYLPEHKDSAYKDLAWKHGNIHLSAPCIYAEVMESLKVGPGMSFLNLGSGTGYLSTMVGLIMGPYGVNHGVEYHQDVIDYAKMNLERFTQSCASYDEFEFCKPHFIRGNCLMLSSTCRLYDRLYCGAACPTEHENYMKNLIKIGGILVMPLNDQLLQICRTSETTWETKNVLPVSFASLIMPVRDTSIDLIDLPNVEVMSLQEVCRVVVRRILRRNIQLENPNMGGRKRPKRGKKKPGEKRRRINLVPMNTGLMILGQFPDRDDPDLDGEAGPHEGALEGRHEWDDDSWDDNSHDISYPSVFMHSLLQHTLSGSSHSDTDDAWNHTDETWNQHTENHETWNQRDESQGADGGYDECDRNGRALETLLENGVAYKSSPDTVSAHVQQDRVDVDRRDMIAINRCDRTMSNGGYSTSYSSGIGTCSSLGSETADIQFRDAILDLVHPDGGVFLNDGGVVHPDGGMANPDRGVVLHDGGMVHRDGGMVHPNGGVVHPDGGVVHPDGGMVHPDQPSKVDGDAVGTMLDGLTWKSKSQVDSPWNGSRTSHETLEETIDETIERIPTSHLTKLHDDPRVAEKMDGIAEDQEEVEPTGDQASRYQNIEPASRQVSRQLLGLLDASLSKSNDTAENPDDGEVGNLDDGEAGNQDDGEAGNQDDGEAGKDGEPSVTFRQCMHLKVEQLPIPAALRRYILFYRD